MTIEYSTLTKRRYTIILDEFYSRSNEKNALKNIEELIISFRNSQIKEMMDFGNTLVKWKYEIVNSFVPANGRRISNGLIENRNKSIKLLKHSSNGYLNWHRFKTRIHRTNSTHSYKTNISYIYRRSIIIPILDSYDKV